MVRLAVLAAIFITSSACTARVYMSPDLYLIANRPGYAVAKSGETSYIIYADSALRAREAADAELDCKKRLCSMQPGGSILFVERPELEN